MIRPPQLCRRPARHGHGCGLLQEHILPSFRGASKTRTRNLEIPRCAIAHLRSGPEPVIGRRKAPTRWDHPGMTTERLAEKSLPSFATAGHFGHAEVLRPLLNTNAYRT